MRIVLLLLALSQAVDDHVIERLTPGSGLTKTADAAPWRGKTVRVTASLRTGGNDPRERARLFLRVVRPNREPGLLDNMAGETVRSAEWQGRELVLPIAADAEKIEYGVLSTGEDEVSVRDLSLLLDYAPVDLHPKVGAPDHPANLDFFEGEPGDPPPGWQGDQAVMVDDDCRFDSQCAVVTGGSLQQTFKAQPWRGGALRFRAWVRLEPATPEASARFFLATENGTWHREVRGHGWVQVELARLIKPETEVVTIGLTLVGEGLVRIAGVTVKQVPQAEATPDSAVTGSPAK